MRQTWVSHTSISDYLKCPKLYFLKNVYKNPTNKHKIMIISPALSLGQCVHGVLETLSYLPIEKRFDRDLLEIYEEIWKTIAGKRGGFRSIDEEKFYKERGVRMLKRVMENPGILKNKALRPLSSPDDFPPRFLLSNEYNIYLNGKVDWMEYLPESDGIHIVDFKTGKYDEKEDSLQLPIYCLLVENIKNRNVKKVSYWYLERDKNPIEMVVPDCDIARENVLKVALKIKLARDEDEFSCPTGECKACRQYKAVFNNEAEYVGETDYQDIYMIKSKGF